ncbi:succinate-semialdehyde dehydrogenase/glutarate-semialdehyde dehydrogenase [Lysinibacillus composti]|uniref:Aldehyde dehydrogenase n=1 Tax=Lysinibacillus composti TaxID=720633 RepID=A0A3N9UJ13_9BACI|nr:NAD-dependent succinate-semialdehyde dehydrogenase [Lysinibacillus composti]MBM7607422.1 succinate-semialdehyde dehydrogenase/glutarate-semialdehyde dehydrogenase [Lysinibacillus composti]RQW76023.1 NAD-dependent succinate-semialdehyde dehydrogenase [Lysinibacillus composti]
MNHWQMIINGKEVDTKEKIEVSNPATLEVIATIPNGGKAEAVQAVNAAANALKAWSQKTANERGQLLMNWFHLVEQEKEEIGKLMTTEQGKPLAEAIGEVNYANSFISWYAEEGKRVYGETVPASALNKRLLVQKQPVGVIAAITPWNFPAAMITRKVAPALAAGCTAVIKPSEYTPLTAIRLIQLAKEAGIPDGVLNVVTGDAQEIGSAWMEDSRVRKVSFTGSTKVGKLLMRQAADTVKKVSLELGGHAPFIVTANADLEKAAKGLIASKYRNAGQTCVCANRVYVHESVEREFIEFFKAEVGKLKVGNGLTEQVDIGPLINESAVKKVKDHLEDAVNKGASLEIGGESVPSEKGYFVTPAVLTNVSDDMKCMTEETFGPIAPITTYKTNQEVIERANNSPYGLAAYIFTQDLAEAIEISEGVEYGIVGLNDGVPSTAQAPFGGFKESGLGREGGHWGIEEYLETKYISIAF